MRRRSTPLASLLTASRTISSRAVSRALDGRWLTIRGGPAAGLRWRHAPDLVHSYWRGTYEAAFHGWLASRLQPGDVFFDVGAHVGYTSLVGARSVGSAGKALAIEAVPANASRIREHLYRNGMFHARCLCVAVGDTEGLAEFVVPYDERTGLVLSSAGRFQHVRGDGEDASQMDRIFVPVVTLDTLVERTGWRPNLIKLDVEGAEVVALRGAARLLAQRPRPELFLELHGPDLARDSEALLLEAGYRLATTDGRPWSAMDAERHVVAVPAERSSSS